MKSIYISKKQEQFLKESIENDKNEKLFSNISISDTLSNIFSINGDNFFKKAYIIGYNNAKNCFNDNIEDYTIEDVKNKLSKLVSICQKKESKLTNELEKLCFETVHELFNIPESNIELECSLVSEINNRTDNFDVTPTNGRCDIEYDDIESMTNEGNEVVKRNIINYLSFGASMKLSEKAIKTIMPKLFGLDEELPHLYSKIIKINDYLLYVINDNPTVENPMQMGNVNVTLGNDETMTKISSKGIIFPVLLSETIRGLMDLFATHGLPDNIELANRVIQSSDIVENERAYMTVGPVLWGKIESVINKYGENKIPYIFKSLVELDSTKLIDLTKELMFDTKKGKSDLEEIAQSSTHDSDYQDFSNDMDKKQKDANLIFDNYFGDELIDENSIEEAQYPETFNMEEFKNLNSYNARIQYCEQRLQRLGSGSSRIVYLIDNETVLKLAKNKKGVAQNEEEGHYDGYRKHIGLFAEVFDVDENYLWIEMELARQAKLSDFKRITGYPFKMIQAYCAYNSNRNTRWQRSTDYDSYFNSAEFQDFLYNDYSIFNQLEDYIGNYGLQGVGDLQRISSWGVVLRDGKEELVLIDYGLTDDIYNQYYRMVK